MAEEAKAGGWLTGAFKIAAYGALAVLGAVGWQLFLDPQFLPILHDVTNVMAQAWTAKVNSYFGWIPQHAGLAREPGLLTPFMEWFLKDEIATIEAARAAAAPVIAPPIENAFIPT